MFGNCVELAEPLLIAGNRRTTSMEPPNPILARIIILPRHDARASVGLGGSMYLASNKGYICINCRSCDGGCCVIHACLGWIDSLQPLFPTSI